MPHRREPPSPRSPEPLRPLRICMVSQSYLPYHGGITEHVWHLSEALARRGHQVAIVTGRPLRNGHPAEPDPPRVRVIRLGRTVRVPSHGARACVVLGCGNAADLLRRLGEAPDLVHIQSPLEPFLPLWALRHLPGVKVGTFHTGGRRDHWGYRRFRSWLVPYLHRLDQRIAVSGEAARFVANHFPGPYAVIPNGVSTHRFPPDRAAGQSAAAAGSPAKPTVLLCVGRLDPRKGLRGLLDAFERIGSRFGPLELWLAGEGPERGRLARRAATRGLRVRFLGAPVRDRLPRIYARADLVIAPAQDGESFGVNLLEAMAAGRPILASDLPAYVDTLGRAGAARFFRAGRVDDLVRALAGLLEDAPLRARMGQAGRLRARGFAWDLVAGSVERVYQRALASSASAGLR